MTVRKRKDTGKWVSDFYYNGERIVKTLKFAKTKREAEQAEAVIMNQVFMAAYGFESKPDTLFENFVVETFLPYSETNKKSFYYDVLICRVLVQAFQSKTLRQITPPMIEALKQELFNKPTKHGQKRSPATVNRHLSALSKIFSLAEDAELVDSNPCKRVRKFKLDNQRIRVLSADEEVRLFSALGKNDLVKQIVQFALHTGMRRGEVFDLKWFDLDFNRDLIQVRVSKSNKKRLVPMNETVRLLLGSLEKKSEYVFPSPKTNNRLNQIKTSFRKAVDKANLKDFRFHDLRHTAASRMAEAGASPFTLMKILGHSDIRMTARYTHATDAALKRAVTNLDVFSQFGNELVTKNKRQAQSLP
ncbi:MAG: tyrosine-type recombinase/integrase [Pyrinomonadaceae bacterium]